MSSNDLDQIINRLDQIEKRLINLEKNYSLEPSYDPAPAPLSKLLPTTKSSKPQDSHFLGYIGAGCILLASLLLIKLSVDSGWLTPIRQCLLAFVLACGFIAFPFIFHSKDKSYFNLLPGVGVVTLHMITYGAAFYHQILDPSFAIFFISMSSLVSLWLLTKLESETYAILAVAGTYVGFYFFHQSFHQVFLTAIYLFLWDATFSFFGIKLKKRSIISLASYLSIGLVAFYGLDTRYEFLNSTYQVLIFQAAQFCLFSFAVIFYSIVNKTSLSVKEAWSFFPIAIFFYGQQFYFIDLISKNAATVFALCFAAFVMAIYLIAKNRLNKDHLESNGAVYSTCAVILGHSLFIVQMNDLFKVIFSALTLTLLSLFHKRLQFNSTTKGPFVVLSLMLIYAYSLVLFGSSSLGTWTLITSGFIFSFFFLFSSQFFEGTKSHLLLYFAHTQVFVSLFRFEEFITSFAIAPLWTLYAFAIMSWGLKRQDLEMSKSAIPLMIISLLRFLIYDFSNLSGLQRVLSLLIMGALIFAAGFLYRKIQRNLNKAT